jgi:hypothetical protein
MTTIDTTISSAPTLDTSDAARFARRDAWIKNLPPVSFPAPWRAGGTIKHLPAAELRALGVYDNSEAFATYRAEFNAHRDILQNRVDVDLTTGAIIGDRDRPKPRTPSTDGATATTPRPRSTPREKFAVRIGALIEDLGELKLWVTEKNKLSPMPDESFAAFGVAYDGVLAHLIDAHSIAHNAPENWGVAPATPRTKGPSYVPAIGDRVTVAEELREMLSQLGVKLTGPMTGTIAAVITVAETAMVSFEGAPAPLPVAFKALAKLA